MFEFSCHKTCEKYRLSLQIPLCENTFIPAKPDPPDGLEFVNATHDSITLKWNAGFDGGLPQGFRVRYKPVATTEGFVQEDVQPPDSTIFTVKSKCYIYKHIHR